MEQKYTVTRDGQTLATYATEQEAWRHLMSCQPASVSHAVRYEGYDIIYPNGTTIKKGKA